jgi:hypothetical protein
MLEKSMVILEGKGDTSRTNLGLLTVGGCAFDSTDAWTFLAICQTQLVAGFIVALPLLRKGRDPLHITREAIQTWIVSIFFADVVSFFHHCGFAVSTKVNNDLRK